MSRGRTVTELLQTAARESAVVQDSFADCIQLLKLAASGVSIAGEADMLLKQLVRRELVSANSYTASDRLLAVLNSTEPPSGVTPVHWENLKAVRASFSSLVISHPARAEHALNKEQNRNWFVGQLVNSGHDATVGTEQLAGLVFKVFAVAAR
jgi:hypothetical protein